MSGIPSRVNTNGSYCFNNKIENFDNYERFNHSGLSVKHEKILELTEKNNLSKIVIEYLDSEKIFYGKVINSIKILEQQGIMLPTNLDEDFSIKMYEDYLKLVTLLSKELVKHIKKLNVLVDRRSTEGGVKHIDKKDNCSNLVFIRYPWEIVKRMKTGVKNSLSVLRKEYLENIDLSKLKDENHKVYELIKKLNSDMKKSANELEKTLNKTFIKNHQDFNNELNKDEKRLVFKFTRFKIVKRK